MKSYDIVEWGKPLQVVMREKPEPTGAEVRVRIDACGVCHSDVHIREGHLDLGNGKKVSFESVGAKLPFTMGHEIVGTVDAIGPDATAKIGAPCVVYPWIGCGKCRSCLSGAELDCESSAGLGTRRAGGYSDYVMVPHSRYILDYGNLDPHVAATCACSGLTAYAALKKLPAFGPDDTILLMGAGGLGLAALGLARRLTRAKLVVADIDDKKLDLAKANGASMTINTRQDNSLQMLRDLVGEPVRAVIDFVGSSTTVSFGLQAVGKGGTVLIVGLFGGALSLSTALLPMRNLTVRGSYVGSLEEMKELLALANEHELLSVPLFSRPMSDINEMLADLENGRVAGRMIATNPS